MNPLTFLHTNLSVESDRWSYWLPLSIATGITAYFALSFEPDLRWVMATPLIGLMAFFLRHHTTTFMLLITLFMGGLGFNAAQIETHLSYTPMIERALYSTPVTGRVMRMEPMPDGVRLTLKDLEIPALTPEKTPRKIRVKFIDKTIDDMPPVGVRISFKAFINPLSEPAAPGAFDFRWNGYFHAIGGMGWARGDFNIIDPKPPTPSWLDAIDLWAARARLILAQHVKARLTGDVATVTTARLNGEQTAIAETVMQDMRVAGLVHLLSTSGYNVTVMGLMAYFPVRFLLALIPWVALRYPTKKWAAVAAIVSATLFTLMVDSGAATLRSLIMCMIAMAAILLERRTHPLRITLLSAVMAMVMAPSATLGPSFQMSFAAVFCLIAFHQKQVAFLVSPDEKPMSQGWTHNFAKYLLTIISTSLIATAAVTPYAVYHFQTFSIYGFLANASAVPLTGFWVEPAMMAAYLLAPFNLDGWFIDIAGFGVYLTIKIAHVVAALPYALLHLPTMPFWILTIITIGGLWMCIWRQKWRWLGLVPILVGMLYPLYIPKPDILVSNQGRVWAVHLEDGRLAVYGDRRNAFLYNQWQQLLGNPPLLMLRDENSDDPHLVCDKQGCIFRSGTQIVAFPLIDTAVLEDCDHADVVIAATNIKDCLATTLIDDESFWNHGSHALYRTTADWRLATSRVRRAARPWNVGWQEPLSLNASWLGEDATD